MSAKKVLLASLLLSAAAYSQGWELQQSNTTADLRGVHSVDGHVVWASGTSGTVLHSHDGGVHWERCPTPPGGEQLDFRGIWAWDEKTAVVMSSGTGEKSRLYKTTDGCLHWQEQHTNPDKDGFWDAVVFQTGDFGFLGDEKTGVLIGDPVQGRFHTEVMVLGTGWFIDDASCAALPGEAAFAASNSSVFVFGSRRYAIGTGGAGRPRVLLSPLLAYGDSSKGCKAVAVPIASGSESSGVFSIAFRDARDGVAVGGDYKKPNADSGTAAWTSDGGLHWKAASKTPHGYRSAVAWSTGLKVWIAVGTNGSDISHDNGDTWLPVDDGPWNALSPPFAVGPGGRIGRLVSVPTGKR